MTFELQPSIGSKFWPHLPAIRNAVNSSRFMDGVWKWAGPSCARGETSLETRLPFDPFASSKGRAVRQSGVY
jgi:hypothetical protein